MSDARAKAAHDAWFRGCEMEPPDWDDLLPSTKNAWRAAANASVAAGIEETVSDPAPGRVYRTDGK